MKKVINEECSVFRDLYKFYAYDDVEKETLKWMKSHEDKCSECKVWIENMNKEDSSEIQNDIKCIKKAKMIMFVGIGIVIFLAVWISIWMFM